MGSAAAGRKRREPARNEVTRSSRTRAGRLRHPSRRALLGGAAIVATVAVVATSLVAYAAYRNVYDSIHQQNVTAGMLGKRPPKLNGSLNILVIGSDSRAGTHGLGKGVVGSRSDTSMLLHISPDHKHALVVSFPRDSMVPILSCLPDNAGHAGQKAAPGQQEMLNATFSYGGAPCLWKTIEQTTGIRIDHFVEVDFNGFKSVVNDVGGVSVCLPYAVRDPASKLNLAAGKHVVTGSQALAFVRERHIGLGSDLQRIQRQQYFLASAMQKIKQTNILANPARLFSVTRDVARSLTADSALSLTTMLAIANSMKGLSSGALRFVSVPVIPDPTDPQARVLWAQPQANRLFHAIAHNSTLPKTSKNGLTPAAKKVSPANVHVDVLNGSGTTGIAGTTATQLGAKGFSVTGTGDVPGYGFSNTVIEYNSASQMAAVATLKAAVGNAQVQQAASVKPGTVALIVGSNFTGLSGTGSSKSTTGSKAATGPPKKGGGSGQNLGKGFGGINGSTSICKDAAAFAGPDRPYMFHH